MKLYLANLIMKLLRIKTPTNVCFEVVSISGNSVNVKFKTKFTHYKSVTLCVGDTLNVATTSTIQLSN